jgi:hypothetical protein
MVKLISLILIATCLILNAGAVVVGPYNMTMGLSGFNDLQLTGPTKNLDAGYTTYTINMAKGNDTTRPLIMTMIVKYNMPIDIDNTATRENYYRHTVSSAFPVGMWYKRGDILFDGTMAASYDSQNTTYRFITYFKDRNTQVGTGAFNLSKEDLDIFLRTFQVQAS